MSVAVPVPYYTLIETSKGNDPAIVVVNSALRTFSGRAAFAWHLKITVDCQAMGANGMPTAAEVQVLAQLEDEITRWLGKDQNSVFLARTTCRGLRELIYRVRYPEQASDALQVLAHRKPMAREWEYRMEKDVDWTLAEPELRLLESDPRLN